MECLTFTDIIVVTVNDIVGEMTKKSNTIKNTQKTSVDLKIHKDKKQLCDAAINLLASGLLLLIVF